jgi:hypothetical protein
MERRDRASISVTQWVGLFKIFFISSIYITKSYYGAFFGEGLRFARCTVGGYSYEYTWLDSFSEMLLNPVLLFWRYLYKKERSPLPRSKVP